MTQYDIQKEINIALMGSNGGYLSQAGKNKVEKGQQTQVPVRVVSNINNINDLKAYGVKSPLTGNKVLLIQVSKAGLKAGITKIRKYDRVPSITFTVM